MSMNIHTDPDGFIVTVFAGPGEFGTDHRAVQITDTRHEYVQMPLAKAIEVATAILEYAGEHPMRDPGPEPRRSNHSGGAGT